MKFDGFKEYRERFSDVRTLGEYLRDDMTRNLRDLFNGLTKLTFLDNFDSFEVEVTIAAGAELEIRNQLVGNLVPRQRIVVRGGTGAENIVDGDTEWSQNFVYLKNTGASSATATVIFLR